MHSFHRRERRENFRPRTTSRPIPPEIEEFRSDILKWVCFSDVNLRELVKPQGYADKLASFLTRSARGI